jgi:hypothetical protein
MTIDGLLDLSVHTLMPSKSTSLSIFKATTPGEYIFYCAVGTHRQAGIVGTLIVAPSWWMGCWTGEKRHQLEHAEGGPSWKGQSPLCELALKHVHDAVPAPLLYRPVCLAIAHRDHS